MIKPIFRGGDYLEFQCEECEAIFHHAVEISHDAPCENDVQRYDVRKWMIMKIHQKCPKCESEGECKLALRRIT